MGQWKSFQLEENERRYRKNRRAHSLAKLRKRSQIYAGTYAGVMAKRELDELLRDKTRTE